MLILNGVQQKQYWRVVLAALLTAAAVVLGILNSKSTSKIAAISQADYIVVEKSQHTMTLLRNGNAIKVYKVALGRGGPGPKDRAGDNKVPEGRYKIVGRNAHSTFHRALRIGYPTAEQRRQASNHAVDAGGDIMVHGIRN